jgi:hypothetical protein
MQDKKHNLAFERPSLVAGVPSVDQAANRHQLNTVARRGLYPLSLPLLTLEDIRTTLLEVALPVVANMTRLPDSILHKQFPFTNLLDWIVTKILVDM